MRSEKEFIGKTALVTGSGRGIGLSIANRLAEEGARTIIADINIERGIAAVQNIRKQGLNVEYVYADLSAPHGAEAMVDEATKFTGSIDILINNARTGHRLGLLEETEENWDQALSVGLKAAFFASQATIKLMAERGGCRIVNIGSVAAWQITLEAPSYHASKSGLMNLTKYLAVAGGRYKAIVNCVLPGLIVQEEHRSRFDSDNNLPFRTLTKSYQPLGEVGTERDVADAVLYFCSDRTKYVSGACLVVDGAATSQEPFGLLMRHSSITN